MLVRYPQNIQKEDIQQVVRGQNIHTWEIAVYKLKLNPKSK